MENPVPVVNLEELSPVLKQRLGPVHARYSFHYCDIERWEKLRLFIRDQWITNHVYVTSPELVQWQQFDSARKRYNFVVAEHRESGEIHSCLGFIFTSHFDSSIPFRDVWLGMWCSRPDAVPGIGGELQRYFIRDARPRSVGALGLSRNTVNLLPRMGYSMGVMDHHYLLNPDVKDHALVGFPETSPQVKITEKYPHRKLQLLSPEEVRSFKIDDFDFRSVIPMKTPEFMYNRYAAHPFYHYDLYAVTDGVQRLGMLVTRVVSANKAKAVRIVDFIGHDQAWMGLGAAMIELLQSLHAEFIDLYSYGLDARCLEASGLIRHGKDDPVIIPLYFEPFEMKNKAIDFGVVIPPGAKYRIFKGDSDQDRPNRITQV